MTIANVSIVGNLVKAPQQTQFASGKVKTTMFVAVNTPVRKSKGGDGADFYKVETWGKLAELVANRLTKGNQVAANGRLLMDKWTDNQGRERVTPTISVYDLAFPPRPRSNEDAVGESADESSSISHDVFAPTSANDDEESDEEPEFDDDEESDDDFGKPNTSTRPAPTRGKQRSPG